MSSSLEGGLSDVGIEVLHRLLCHLLLSPEDEVGVSRDSIDAFVHTLRRGIYMHTLREGVEPPIMDTLKSGQPPYNGQTVHSLAIYCPYISTSEERTTSEQWTKCSSPKCPLFGCSTV